MKEKTKIRLLNSWVKEAYQSYIGRPVKKPYKDMNPLAGMQLHTISRPCDLGLDGFNIAKKVELIRKAHAVTASKRNKVKPFCCGCNATQATEGHHPDYRKPKEIVWLCAECHGKEHIRLGLIRQKETINDSRD